MGNGDEKKAASLNYLETKDDIETLVELNTPEYYLRFDKCHYGLELKATIRPRTSGKVISKEDLDQLFSNNHIRGSFSRKNIEEFCHLASQGRDVRDITLVRGVYPVQGDDERMTFVAKPKSNKPHIHSHGSEDQDVGEISTNTFFDNISKGDVIAIKTPPDEGIPGTAVDGAEIPPLNGRYLIHSPRPGKGVRFDKKTHKFYADTDGCVVYNEGRGIISVEEKLILSDDVDFIVGHIDFVGDVEIHGDVLDDLHVKAGKNIVVTGHVGDGILDAVGNVTIGGISGHGRGLIRCGGELHSRYVDSAIIEAIGDIYIANEVIDSKVMTAAALHAPAARIIGGECFALKGVEGGEIGSEVNIPTAICVGRSFIALKLVEILNGKIERCRQRMKKIGGFLKSLKTDQVDINSLGEEQRQKVDSLLAEEQKLNELKGKLEDSLAAEKERVTEGANPLICAGQGVWSGVNISFGKVTEVIRDDIDHPVSLIEDVLTGHYRAVKHVPVTTRVEDIKRSKRKRKRR